jgi:hypothetical protein
MPATAARRSTNLSNQEIPDCGTTAPIAAAARTTPDSFAKNMTMAPAASGRIAVAPKARIRQTREKKPR